MIEKIGGLTFKDGILVSGIDSDAEIAKRGGLDAMLAESVKHNAFMARLHVAGPTGFSDPSCALAGAFGRKRSKP